VTLAMMIEHAHALALFVRSGREKWQQDANARLASRHHLLLMGVAATTVPAVVRQKDTAIPWDGLACFPRLLQEPWGVDDEAVWGAMVSLPPVEAKLASLSGDAEDPGVA